MYTAMLIAASGIQRQQRRMDEISHNVANVNTVAFKTSRLDFKDAMYTAGLTPAQPRTPEGNQQRGNGVMVAGATKNFSVGIIRGTDRPLDVAIEGEGFFSLEDASGTTVYTRAGNFYFGVDEDGYTSWLVNGEGHWVLDADGARIQVPDGTTLTEIDENGVITFTAGGEMTVVPLGIFTFRNVTGLLALGGGSYLESEASGERLPVEGVRIRQGAIEGSNVDLSEQMTLLIRTQRAFSLASRALTTADEMEGIANNMRR